MIDFTLVYFRSVAPSSRQASKQPLQGRFVPLESLDGSRMKCNHKRGSAIVRFDYLILVDSHPYDDAFNLAS
jgi:hypothetical protein